MKYTSICLVMLIMAVCSVHGQTDYPVAGLSVPNIRLVSDSGVDLNGDGYFEHLDVEIEVAVEIAGKYTVCCEVITSDGVLISRLRSVAESEKFWRCRSMIRHFGWGPQCEERSCQPEANVWRFRFSGEEVYKSGIDGKYFLRVSMDGPNEISRITRFETVHSYEHEKFRELSRIVSIEEYPVDVNDDNLFDYLEFKVQIDGSGEPNLPVLALLYADTELETDSACLWMSQDRSEKMVEPAGPDSGGRFPDLGLNRYPVTDDLWDERDPKKIARFSVVDATNRGKHTVIGRFAGSDIRTNGFNGPFILRVMLGNWCGEHDCRKILTEAYDYKDFSGTPLTVDSVSEPTVDIDKNELRDVLRIKLDVTPQIGGEFLFYGWLEDSTGTALAFSKVRYRSATRYPAEVNIDFSGDDIAVSGVDGPYRVRLLVKGTGERKDVWWFDYFHQTAAYKSTDFESALLALTGGMFHSAEPMPKPHSVLSYVAVLTGSIKGQATASADLCDSAGNIIQAGAEGSTIVRPGAGNPLRIDFSGGLIATSGSDGPYWVRNLRVVHEADRSRPLTVDTAYRIDGYKHSDFVCYKRARIDAVSDWGVDTDGDGRYDSLAIQLNLTCCREGEYSFSAHLRTYSLCSIAGHSSCQLELGMNACTLWVDGGLIGKSGEDGPYIVSVVMSCDSALLGTTSVTTSAYSHTEFEGVPMKSNAIRLERVARSGEGATEAGSSEEQVVTVSVAGEPKVETELGGGVHAEVSVQVIGGGKFNVYGRLVGSSGRVLALSQAECNLRKVGFNRISLSFDDEDILRHKEDGSYRLKDLVFERTDGAGTFMKRLDYPPSVFQTPLVRVEGDFVGQSAVWSEPDGKFLVRFSAVGDEPGKMTATADLFDASGVLLAEGTCTVGVLRPGYPSGFFLKFDGERARKESLRGPYFVRNLRLTHSADPEWQVVFDEVCSIDANGPSAGTAGKRRSVSISLEPGVGASSAPSAAMSAVSDRGSDVDGDGLFDSLVVGVTVMVKDAGDYRIHAVLVLDSAGIYPVIDTVSLTPGEHLVELAYASSAISRWHLDGPYRVNVVVFQGPYPLDNTHYWTAAYKHTEFEKSEKLK